METILDQLLGDWLLEREIDNGVTVTGRATFSLGEASGLSYRENGRMTLPGGGAVDAYADYRFTLNGVRLVMLYAEDPPRLFQAFDLEADGDTLTGESLHDCPPDTYRSRIAFQPDGTWRLTHAVAGPRKRYVSRTRYRRALDLTAI